MVDSIPAKERSALMTRVRQKDTAPEIAVRKYLHNAGLRYVLHSRALPGRPDLAFPKYGVALFVHGCYWHGHSCRAGRPPTSNTGYWRPKLEENKKRDIRKEDELRDLGWRVVTVWECEVKSGAAEKRLTRLVDEIRG